MPHRRIDPDARSFARKLRKNATEEERLLWWALRGRHGTSRFRRQHPIGPYFVDFVCLRSRLVIEVDGWQHAGSIRDRRRDAYLRNQNFTVLRFWNDEIRWEMDWVLDVIDRALTKG